MTGFQVGLLAAGLVAMVGSLRVGAILCAGVICAAIVYGWADPQKSLALAIIWTSGAVACWAVGSSLGACALALVSLLSVLAAFDGRLTMAADLGGEGLIYALAAWSFVNGPGSGPVGGYQEWRVFNCRDRLGYFGDDGAGSPKENYDTSKKGSGS